MNIENVIPKPTQINMVIYWKELSSKINCFLNLMVAEKILHDWEVNSSQSENMLEVLSFKPDKLKYVPHPKQTATV